MSEESADALFVGTLDRLTAEHPHTDDPRFAFQSNQWNNCEVCQLRLHISHINLSFVSHSFAVALVSSARTTQDASKPLNRPSVLIHAFLLRYQYYRAQTVCHEFLLEDWMEHRHRGSLLRLLLRPRDLLQVPVISTLCPIARSSI